MAFTAFSRISRYLLPVVLALSVVLRVSLSVVNRESNDPHMPVVRMIAENGTLPKLEDHWEGFQPKLYHATTAFLIRETGIDSESQQIILAQLLSTAAGLITLVCIFLFLRDAGVSPFILGITVALCALNPKLIGINAQATNDSFVIAACSATILYVARYVRDGRLSSFILVTLFAILSGLAKGNGILMFFLVLTVLGVIILRDLRSGKTRAGVRSLGMVGVFMVAWVGLTLPLGQYWERYQNHGSPFVINWPKAQPPKVLTPTYPPDRPLGIVSIVQSYLTFMPIQLLRTPYVEKKENERFDEPPRLRTSFWTLLYGLSHSIHFSRWPPSWGSDHWMVLNLTRMILMLAVIPTAVLLLGAGVVVRRCLSIITDNHWVESSPFDITAFVAAGGYLAFMLLYTFQYRAYVVIKAIFFFPALVSLAYCFAEGACLVVTRQSFSPAGKMMFASAVIGLCLLYAVDVGILVLRLVFSS